MTDRPIRVVFDRSAVLAYARSAVAVGELLIEIDDEGGAAAIPLACLVEAALAAVSFSELDVLVGHPATVVLADDPTLWRDLAALRGIVGGEAAASAALLAIDLNVDILTRTPRAYAGVGDGSLALPFDE